MNLQTIDDRHISPLKYVIPPLKNAHVLQKVDWTCFKFKKYPRD